MKSRIECIIAIMLMITIVLLVVILMNLKNINNRDNIDIEKPIVNDPGNISKMTGIISNINTDGQYTTVLVENGIESTVGDKAMVNITNSTILSQDEMSRVLNISEFKTGDKVEIIFTGPILESYPVQGTAANMRKITK